MCKYDIKNYYIYIIFISSVFEMSQEDGKQRQHKEGCIDFQLGGYL